MAILRNQRRKQSQRLIFYNGIKVEVEVYAVKASRMLVFANRQVQWHLVASSCQSRARPVRKYVAQREFFYS